MVLDWVLPWVDDSYYQEALAGAHQYFGVGYFAFGTLGAALTLYFMLERRFDLARKLVASGIVGVIGLSAFVVPVGAGVQQDPIKQAALLARANGYEVIMWRLNAPSFSVYYGRPTPTREPQPGDIVITKARRMAELPNKGYEVVYEKNGIVLVRLNR